MQKPNMWGDLPKQHSRIILGSDAPHTQDGQKPTQKLSWNWDENIWPEAAGDEKATTALVASPEMVRGAAQQKQGSSLE